jgi:hypothetical protein
MSNQRFDKILKNSLESVRPPYEPSAWQRFSKRLPATGVWPWVQQFGGWVLCGMMLAGWGTTLFALKENQELIRQISSGQISAVPSAPPAPEAPRPSPSNFNQAVHKTDTVYIVRKTIVEHHYVNANKANSTSQPTSETPYFEEKKSVLEKTENPAELADEVPQKAISQFIQRNDAEKAETVSLLPLDENTNPVEQAVATDTGRAVMSEVAVISPDSLVIYNALQYKSIKSLIDSISEQRYSRPLDQVATHAPKTPFRFADLQPRFGIGSHVALHSYGFGASVELFPIENLGFSFGIQASKLEAENHKALRDYNSATGKLFVVQYRSYLPSRFDRIEDISIKTTVVSLPVNLKYYVPIKKDLSLFVHSGTTLDLSAYQQVNFESYLNRSKRRNTFETGATANFFHNFLFGAGLQYQSGKISGQLSPYYIYDFRNIVHTPSGGNLGLKGSIWINLFR